MNREQKRMMQRQGQVGADGAASPRRATPQDVQRRRGQRTGPGQFIREVREEMRQVADPVLANVRGAGLLTFLALGRVKVEDLGAMIDVKATFEPDRAQAKVYDKLYPEFVNLYKRTKQIHKRLNRH